MFKLSQAFEKFSLSLLEGLGTPRSLTVSILIRYGEWEQVAALAVVPEWYNDSLSFYKDNLATCLLKKLARPGDESKLDAECWARFRETEAQCCRTNVRFQRLIDGPMDHEDARLLPFLGRIRKKVAWLMGPVPSNLEGAFGPGSTLGAPSRRSTALDKFQLAIEGTASCVEVFYGLYGKSTWLKELCASTYGSSSPLIRRGGRFFTVPKDATKKRGAFLSPTINGFLQKGVGTHLRRRLAKLGYPLDGANPLPSLHKKLAREGSREGTYATIDLSDASNTISKDVVRFLLPELWYDTLSSLREAGAEGPDGRFYRFEMFSAMGNGFTFELETIIFLAIALVATEESGGEAYAVSVFGDDIIVPQVAADATLAALRFFGFTPNTKKTFIQGVFRESCGGDYFNGFNVRGHYVKKEPSEPTDWIGLANGINRMVDRDHNPGLDWTSVRRAWKVALGQLPLAIRQCTGPQWLGDICVHTVPETWNVRVKFSIREFRAYIPVPKAVPLSWFDPWVQYVGALYGVPSTGPIARSSVSGYRVAWVPSS